MQWKLLQKVHLKTSKVFKKQYIVYGFITYLSPVQFAMKSKANNEH